MMDIIWCVIVQKGVAILKARIYVSAAILGSLWWTAAGTVEASLSHPFWDVPSYFQTLRDAREQVINRRQAEAYVRSAKAYVKEAQISLKQARKNLEDAKGNEADARKGLEDAKERLETARKALETAKERSRMAEREEASATEEADIARRDVSEKREEVSSLESEVSYGENTATGYKAIPNEEREKRIQEAWEKVNYAPSYLEDIRREIDGEGETEETEEEIEEENALSHDLEEAEEELSYLEDLLAEKEDALAQAEMEAEDARQEVKDWMDEYQSAQQDIADSHAWLLEAEKETSESVRDVTLSIKEVEEAQREEKKASYELLHLGEGVSSTTGMEYASWKGDKSQGHQLIIPYSVYAKLHKGSMSLSTGYMASSISATSGEGTVHHLTDTSLSFTYDNNHKKNETHYILGLNLPTGKSDTHPDAAVPSLLGRYTTFGEGFNVTPAIEGVHHFNEVDSIRGLVSYSFRGDYTTRQWDFLKEPVHRVMSSRVSPGHQLLEEVYYIHAGDTEQLLAFLRHSTSSSMTQHLEGGLSLTSQEGDSWDFGIFYDKPLSYRDSWQAYWIHDHEDPQKGAYASLSGGMSYDGFGIGLSRKYNAFQRGQIMIHSLFGNGHTENWRSGLGTNHPRRYSLEALWEWKLDERNTIRLMGERYFYKDRSLGDYHGWNVAIYGSHTY